MVKEISDEDSAGIIVRFCDWHWLSFGRDPLPAPPALVGALLVLAMTLGYSLVDRVAPHREAEQRKNCGGPNGL
ncbi:DUF1427 family protein [Shewanella dokdonensis]|uniref:DUF1427 family protein n=1 Tax=Shewanella dokdonensis TaxID=712036 RepID=UPI001FD31B3E|nr:DUF1427 family protein [Shewanella dokdonensis]